MSIQEKYDDAYKNAKNLKGGDQQDQLDVSYNFPVHLL
jgi:hypothetical protein